MYYSHKTLLLFLIFKVNHYDIIKKKPVDTVTLLTYLQCTLIQCIHIRAIGLLVVVIALYGIIMFLLKVGLVPKI